MIPVTAQPEPADFDVKVRKKGLAYLARKGFSLNQPFPPKTEIKPYWRDCLSDLHRSYGGVCAYLCVFFERVTGSGSVDHFIAKSANAGLAYEWSNYRLACSTMNSRKREYADVLDPFELTERMFRLDLVTGHIYPNPNLDQTTRDAVKETIQRLGLDDALCRELRTDWYQYHLRGDISSTYLEQKSPFVWYEAKLQGLL